MMVKDYRGKNGEREIWGFDAALNAQLLDLLKQAAIEEGQWGAKQEGDPEARLAVTIAYLNAGYRLQAAPSTTGDVSGSDQRKIQFHLRKQAAGALIRGPVEQLLHPRLEHRLQNRWNVENNAPR